jgi:UDP-N-acetylglucosamine acyltransferase
LYGLNLIGLKRRGLQPSQLAAIKKAYRTFFTEGLSLKAALARVRQESPSFSEVAHLVEFIACSQRGICRPRGHTDPEEEAEPV